MITKNWIWVIFTVIFAYISTTKYTLIKSLNYNQDEIDYTGNALLWYEYKPNYNHSTWSMPWAYDQPHLYHFILGALTDKQTLTDLGFDKRYPDRHQFMVRWNLQCIGNYYNNHSPRCNFINQIRYLSFTFYLLCFILISLISYQILGKSGLISTLIFFYFSRNIDNNLITAVSDSLLLFWILLSLLFSVLHTKYKFLNNIGYLITQSVIAGLAFSTKINGGILIIILNSELLLLRPNFSYIKLLLLNSIPPFIFILTNPYLWHDTFSHIIKMITYRFQVNDLATYYASESGPPNNFILDRLFFNSKQLLDPSAPSIFSTVIVVTLIFLTSKALLRKNDLKPTQITMLYFSFCLLLIPLGYISVYWNRYYIPAQFGLYLNMITLVSLYLPFVNKGAM